MYPATRFVLIGDGLEIGKGTERYVVSCFEHQTFQE